MPLPFATSRIHLIGCVVLAGCPQLLSDEFDIRDLQNVDAGGSAGVTANGGAGGLGGAGGTGSLSAGAGGVSQAGSAGRPATGGSAGVPVPVEDPDASVEPVADAGDGGVVPGSNVGPDTGPPVIDAGAPQVPLCTGEFNTPVPLDIPAINAGDSLYGPWPFGDQLLFSNFTGIEEGIFSATRGTGVSYSTPVLVPNVNSASFDGAPSLSFDGRELFFFSNRGGNRDIFRAVRTSATGTFGAASSVLNVNSTSLEGSPRLSSDGSLLRFVSVRGGSSDLWQSTKNTTTGEFGTASLLNDLSSSTRDEGPAFSTDDLTAYLSSDRDGGSMSVYRATRTSTDELFSNPVLVSSLFSTSDDMDIALSSDGLELYLSSVRGGSIRVYRSTWICD